MSIHDYWTRSKAAAELGISIPTLKKYEERAESEGYGLSEDFFMVKNTKLWHKDEWILLQKGRLQPFLDEAFKLGLAVSIEDNRTAARNAYNEGFIDGAASVAAELPIEPDSEDAEYLIPDNGALVQGGFVPLSQLM